MDSINQWFINPIKDRYFDFDGRDTVQQYWMFTLWYFIFSIILGMVAKETATTLFSLALLFPSLGIGARRLHDIGKSGWWQLLWFIPIIGWIILIVFLVTKSDLGTNSYGPDPKGSVSAIPVPTPTTETTPAPVLPTSSAMDESASYDTGPK